MTHYIFRPTEVPRQQRLLSAWWQSEVGHRYAQGWINDVRAKGKMMFTSTATGGDLAMQEAHRVVGNRPYWVSADMVELTERASLTIPEFTLREDVLPSPTGFMYLAYPRRVLDSNDEWVSEQVIVWNSTGPFVNEAGRQSAGVYLTWYSDRDNLSDEGLSKMRPGFREALGQFVLLHVAFWPYGTGFLGGAAVGKSGEEIDFDERPWLDWRRFIVTAWRLMAQPLVTTVAVPAGRAETKSALRAKMPVHDVNVITLRRAEPRAEAVRADALEHRPVDWRCRWIVRGHWRNQPHRDGVRPIWIDPYVKGPEDRPLRFATDVYAWRR